MTDIFSIKNGLKKVTQNGRIKKYNIPRYWFNTIVRDSQTNIFVGLRDLCEEKFGVGRIG